MPSMTGSWSTSCLTTSLALEPETSIQILEKKAHELITKTAYMRAWIGSVIKAVKFCGGLM